MKGKLKGILGVVFTFIMVVSLFGVSPAKVKAAPAPSLTSLQIIDLALDDYNQIYVVTREIGTSKSGMRFVYWNGKLCDENLNETVLLTGSDRIVYGYIRYFATGTYYSNDLSGRTYNVSARSTNAMSPWNTLSTSATFTLP